MNRLDYSELLIPAPVPVTRAGGNCAYRLNIALDGTVNARTVRMPSRDDLGCSVSALFLQRRRAPAPSGTPICVASPPPSALCWRRHADGNGHHVPGLGPGKACRAWCGLRSDEPHDARVHVHEPAVGRLDLLRQRCTATRAQIASTTPNGQAPMPPWPPHSPARPKCGAQRYRKYLFTSGS